MNNLSDLLEDIPGDLAILLEDLPNPTVEHYRTWLQGNIDAIKDDGINDSDDALALYSFYLILENIDELHAHWPDLLDEAYRILDLAQEVTD